MPYDDLLFASRHRGVLGVLELMLLAVRDGDPLGLRYFLQVTFTRNLNYDPNPNPNPDPLSLHCFVQERTLLNEDAAADAAAAAALAALGLNGETGARRGSRASVRGSVRQRSARAAAAGGEGEGSKGGGAAGGLHGGAVAGARPSTAAPSGPAGRPTTPAAANTRASSPEADDWPPTALASGFPLSPHPATAPGAAAAAASAAKAAPMDPALVAALGLEKLLAKAVHIHRAKSRYHAPVSPGTVTDSDSAAAYEL